MIEQNIKNHGRYIPFWHFIVPVILLATLTGSIINLVHSNGHTHYSAVVIAAMSVLFIIFYWYARWFALRAQDRAIRAEENFRHFILTGKPFDSRLHLEQIIALRFASDDEMPALAKRAAEENLSSKEIKTAVQNWKPDYHRV